MSITIWALLIFPLTSGYFSPNCLLRQEIGLSCCGSDEEFCCPMAESGAVVLREESGCLCGMNGHINQAQQPDMEVQNRFVGFAGIPIHLFISAWCPESVFGPGFNPAFSFYSPPIASGGGIYFTHPLRI